MARITVDIEQLMVGLLSESFPDADVRAAPDVDLVDSLPMIVVQPVTGQMVSNGNPHLGWTWIVSLTMYAETPTAASDFADQVYGKVHGFEDDQAAMAGVGYVSSVEDRDMPTRTGTVTGEHRMTQFNGAWTITVLPDSD